MARYGFHNEPVSMKAFILFVMSRSAENITFDDLIEMVLMDENMDYFLFFESVEALVNSGHILQEKGKFARDVYNITPRGRDIAEYTESTLPHALRRASEAVIKEVSERVWRDACIETSIFFEGEEPMASLRLTDGIVPLMHLEIVAGSEEEARKLCTHFRLNAENIFEEVAKTVRKNFAG